MKKVFLWVICMMVLLFSAGAQNNEKKKNTPDEKITVKREFDKDGNLISFDSLRVYSWSTDSAFQIPQGWENFFGKDFFDDRFGKQFPGDTAFSFAFPQGTSPFRFFDEEDLLKGFGLNPDDSVDFRNYIFHNDTSFFMGPKSSFMLPPGFFVPDMKGMQDLEKYFDQHFKSFSPDEFYNNPGEGSPFKRFMDPQQQEEWNKLIEKQQQEQQELYKKWNKQKSGKKTEKM
jgi:hypothetical protein